MQITSPEDPNANKKQIILLLVLFFFSIAIAIILTRQPLVLIRSDHYSRWYATQKLVLEGRSLYNPQNGRDVMALNPAPVDPIYADFYYPAYLIVFILPLISFSYPWAHFIWMTFIQVLMILAIWLTYREIRWPNTINGFTAILILSVLFIPNLQNTIWGQYNTIAVISLILTYMGLRRQRYFLAGVLATGMTFKPQQMLLLLAFLLLWSLFQRERRKFILGFGVGMLALLLFPTLFEPRWIFSFLSGIQQYSNKLNSPPILSLLGVPGWILWTASAGFWVWALSKNRQAGPESTVFAAGIVLSLAVWWLFVPVVGMMHLVVLPAAVMLLLGSLEKSRPRLYPYGVWAFILLYAAGVVVFVYGLSSPNLYGLHIELSELAYKLIAPVLLILLAVPLCLDRKDISLR